MDRMRRGITWLELLLIALIAVVLVAVFRPIYMSTGGGAIRTQCLSNVKQLCLSSLMYASDHDDRFMPRDTWMDVTQPYRKNWEIAHCPTPGYESPDPKSIFGYAFNSRLALKKGEDIPRPADTPLHYDSINYARNASDPVASLPNPMRMHGKSRANIVGYSDGHVKALHPKTQE